MSVTQEFKLKKALSNAKKLSAQGRLAEAMGIYAAILQQQPHHTEAKKNLAKLEKKLPADSGVKAGNAQAANPQPAQQQIDALIALYNAGRMQDTEQAAKKLLAVFPARFPLYNIYGAALLEQGKAIEALAVFEKALALKPDEALAHSNLGSVLHRLDRLDKSLQSYDQAIQLAPGQARAYINRGNVLVALGRREQALENYQHVLQIKPDHLEALYSRANVLSELDRLDEALAGYDACLGLNPEFIEALVNRGNALKRLGRRDEAITSFQQAIRLAPEKAEASINLGNILTSQGQFEQAVTLLQPHLEKDPANSAALGSLVGALNYCAPDAAVPGALAGVQRQLQNLTLPGVDAASISDEEVKNLYRDGRQAIATSGLSVEHYAATQVWRGKAYYQGCDRHFVVFNRFNAIPKYCFSCYKVYVEPRSVIELFKLMLLFNALDIPDDKVRKCMIETRAEISGAYKGYIYCQGREEGEQILKLVEEVVAQRISPEIKVALKRGCSEYAQSYPEFVQHDAQGDALLQYREEWAENEDFADKNLVKHIYAPVLDSYNHAGLTLHDILVMHNWLAYAAAIDDSSYLEITGTPVPKMQMGKRSAFQPGSA